MTTLGVDTQVLRMASLYKTLAAQKVNNCHTPEALHLGYYCYTQRWASGSREWEQIINGAHFRYPFSCAMNNVHPILPEGEIRGRGVDEN